MFIIDTNVISELRKPDRSNPKVLEWARRVSYSDYFLSSVTVLEIRYGALLLQRRDPFQGGKMLNWLSSEVLALFEGRILPVDLDVAMVCAALHVPDPRPDRDAYIAATALVHDLTVVTRNTRDFESMGVKLVNPWLG